MRTVHVILGASMVGHHASLERQANLKKLKLNELKTGEAVLFINRRKDKMKAYSFNGVVSYIRFDDPKRGIDMDTIHEIPRAFSSDGTLDYTKALRDTLEKKLRVTKFKDLEIL